MRYSEKDIEDFLDAYIEAAFFTENDESDSTGGEPLENNYSREDLSPGLLSRMRADCVLFMTANKADLNLCQELMDAGKWKLPSGVICSVLEYAGHNFWMTRNGEGVGFYDGWPDGYIGIPKVRLPKKRPISSYCSAMDCATRLTDSAQSFKKIDLFVYEGRIDSD